MIIIRKSKENDLSFVIEIALSEIYDDIEPSLAEGYIKDKLMGVYPHTQCFVAENDENDEIVGFIVWKSEDLYESSIHESNIILEINLMAVDEDNQRLGIGTRLVKETLPIVKESFGVLKADVMVIADERPSKKFYRKILTPYFESREPFNRTHFYFRG